MSSSRADDGREARLEDGDNGSGVVDGEGGLRDVGQPLGVAGRKAASVIHSFDQRRRPGRQLSQCADYLGVAGVADQNDLQAGLLMGAGLHMHLGDERAGGIEVEHVAGPGRRRHGLRHPVCRKDHGRLRFGDFVQLLHKNGAFGSQGLHHVPVVDDLMANVDRSAILLERQLDNLDGAIDTGTKTARGGYQDFERGTSGSG
jgi:hypothetical protein